MKRNSETNSVITSDAVISTVEVIISNKVKAIKSNPSFVPSMSLHTIAYVEILDALGSTNDKLKKELKKLEQESYLKNLKEL